MSIPRKLQDWYHGPWMESEPGSSLVFMNHRQQPKVAWMLGKVGRFIASEWKWLMTIAVAVIGIEMVRKPDSREILSESGLLEVCGMRAASHVHQG